jgi:hypothetical protein
VSCWPRSTASWPCGWCEDRNHQPHGPPSTDAKRVADLPCLRSTEGGSWGEWGMRKAPTAIPPSPTTARISGFSGERLLRHSRLHATRPGAFTKPGEPVASQGNGVATARKATGSPGTKNNGPGGASLAGLNRGGTPRQESLGSPPAPRNILRRRWAGVNRQAGSVAVAAGLDPSPSGSCGKSLFP